MTTTLEELLEGRVSAGSVVAFAPGLERYRHDETRTDGATPRLILRPASTADVSTMLAACNRIGQKLVVQGGRTGLTGAARPREGEIVLSLERLADIGEPDPVSASILVDAGVPLQKVLEKAAGAGLQFGVDIGARGTATVGGNIATNAGGIRVLRHGMFRAQVRGLEAVLADGTVLSSLEGLVKDNAGYDLKQLFIGSEGTLAVVTRARLALSPAPMSERLAFCAVGSLADSQALLVHLRRMLGHRLSAFEAIWGPLYDAMTTTFGAGPLATGAAVYLIVETQDQIDPEIDEALETAMFAAYEGGLCGDIVMAKSGAEIARIWRMRENCSEFVYRLPRSIGHDVSVGATRMGEFFERAARDVATADREAETYVFGHLGDGNVHYIVDTAEPAAVANAVFGAAAACGGSISAEHGIGLDKKPYLSLVRDAGWIGAMRRLKDAFDPHHILNCDRIFDTQKPQ